MQLWIAHNAARACFVPPSGQVILFDFHNCEHLSAHLPLVAEVRGGASFFYFETGNRTDEHAAAFTQQITDLMATYAPGNKRLAVDKIETAGYAALLAAGVDVLEGQVLSEHARAIKNENELNAMRCAIHACEQAVEEMRHAVRPGYLKMMSGPNFMQAISGAAGNGLKPGYCRPGRAPTPGFRNAARG